MTEENYAEALKLLQLRYENKRIIFQAHIRALHEIKPMSRSSESLRNVIDTVNANVRALKSLGSSENIANALLLFIITSKLDMATLSKWEEEAPTSELPTWENLEACLTKRCHALENKEYNVEPCSGKGSHNTKPYQNRSSLRTTLNTTVSVNTQKCCVLCDSQDHDIIKCQRFNMMTVGERFNEAKKLNLCINCLRGGHRVKFCRSRRCMTCRQRHHTLLHHGGEKPISVITTSSPSSPPVIQSTEQVQPSTSTTLKSTLQSSFNSGDVFCLNNRKPTSVILATAVVNVRDSFGEVVRCRVLLDSASQINFISEWLAQVLRIERSKTDVTVNGLNDIKTHINSKSVVQLESRLSSYMTELEVLIVPRITADQPDVKFDISDWAIPSHVKLADPEFNRPHRVDMLLGAELFYELMGVNHLKLSPDLPSLHETVLGWIVAGKIILNDRKYVFSTTVGQPNCNLNQNVELERLLEQFWSIEDVDSVKHKQWTRQEEECEQHFLKTVKRDTDGRFIVQLPLKRDPKVLGDSFWIAKTRLINLEKKLQRNPEMMKMYEEFLSEYENLSHMQRVVESEQAKCLYFMPHHCVLKPESTSTRLRVVFDASSKTTSGESLNSILKVGPTIQKDLFSIILRFRSHRYALTADISKMYRQVLVDKDQSYLQCILWRSDPSKAIDVFRLNTVTYGTASASFLVIRCLHFLAREYLSTHPLGAKRLLEDFYVDDMLSGADTIDHANQIRKEISEILRFGCFDLRKWSSNDRSLLEDVPLECQEARVSIESNNSVKTLGLSWSPNEDDFRFEFSSKSMSAAITKRKVLSDIATLFDPLGFINPIVVSAKIFMQHLWRLKIDWDSELPDPYKSQWVKFRDQLPMINSLVFPRFVRAAEYNDIELHGFADASTTAYGCCIFVRCISADSITCRLVCAKSRVAPIKTLSLPKLELCAAELLANLLSRVVKELEIKFRKVYCWTDSEIVLCWLAAHPSNWTTFVSNRVSTIQHLTDDFVWMHVDTKNNPADLVSRGVSPDKLSKHHMWFTGPEYLRHDYQSWPLQKRSYEFDGASERRKNACALPVAAEEENVISRCKFSNAFPRLRRVFAYVIRFVDIKFFKRKREGVDGVFTPNELYRSTKLLVRITQKHAFGKEYGELMKGRPVPNSSCMKYLSPFVDGEDIIRVGGRIQQSGLAFDVLHPMLLPNYTPFVFSLFEHYHFRNLHAGPQSLHAAVRQEFWVIRGRDVARLVVQRCVICFRCRPRFMQQMMGSLPRSRVQPARPFETCGVDFCGPLWVHYKQRGKAPAKAYVAVFICFVTKAVHMEIVCNLTSKKFIEAVKRFVGRRGLCRKIYCDNATNFVGGRREMREFRELFFRQEVRQHIVDSCAEDNILFEHIPPRSPHFGGLWEAAVKSAKHHLNRLLHGTSFTYDELETIIIQVEAILNSRPLTPMSSDPADFTALTPGHFIIGAPLTAPIEPNMTDVDVSRLDQFQRIRLIQQTLWERWRKEYLTQLQHRAKWRSPTKIKTGTMVLVSEDNVPPQKWLLGRIIHLHPGEDGRIRVVTVQTAYGEFKRAIHKLAPLPIEDSAVDDDQNS